MSKLPHVCLNLTRSKTNQRNVFKHTLTWNRTSCEPWCALVTVTVKLFPKVGMLDLSAANAFNCSSYEIVKSVFSYKEHTSAWLDWSGLLTKVTPVMGGHDSWITLWELVWGGGRSVIIDSSDSFCVSRFGFPCVIVPLEALVRVAKGSLGSLWEPGRTAGRGLCWLDNPRGMNSQPCT